MQLTHLTDTAIRDEIDQLTAQLDKDDRATRPAADHDGPSVKRAVLHTTVDEDGDETTRQVGESVELPTAERIRAERRAVKLRRRALRRELERRMHAAEAARPTRTLEAIEAHNKALNDQLDGIRAQLKENAREIDRVHLREWVDQLSPTMRASLSQVLGPLGVPSSSKVGTPQ